MWATTGCARRCTGRESSAPYPDPGDAGTAAVHLMHASGTLEGKPGRGAMCRRDGPDLVRSGPRRRRGPGPFSPPGYRVVPLFPARGSGSRWRDGPRAGGGFHAIRDARWRCAGKGPGDVSGKGGGSGAYDSPVLKINCGSERATEFFPDAAGPEGGTEPGHGDDQHGHRRHPGGGTRRAGAACPPRRACELLHSTTALRPRRWRRRDAIPMSVFGPVRPYQLPRGVGRGRSGRIADAAIAEVERFAPGWPVSSSTGKYSCPPVNRGADGPDGPTSSRVTALAEQLWDRRFGPRLPIRRRLPVRCGHASGGSVIAVNGRKPNDGRAPRRGQLMVPMGPW